MRLVNLTPHPVVLIADDGMAIIQPSGVIARCAVQREHVGAIKVDGIVVPIHRTFYGAVEGLPAPEPGTLYIVSALVAQASDRDDVVVPDDVVRDEQGRIVGAKALAKAAK